MTVIIQNSLIILCSRHIFRSEKENEKLQCLFEIRAYDEKAKIYIKIVFVYKEY